tara:strand:- start:955 stop:1623 length:669 start_codon:yes stop_codon:yes gene_type:complete
MRLEMSLGELTKAHGQFLKAVGTIQKESQAQYGKFADLASILAVVNPKLAENGLSVHQTFKYTEAGQQILLTHLHHVSGECIKSELLMPVNQGRNPLHDFGGACTYCRRYSLLAILGLQAGIEDDDGDHADIQQEPLTANPKVNIPKQQSDDKTIQNPPIEPDYLNAFLVDLKAWAERKPKEFSLLKQSYFKKFPDFQGSFGDHIQEPQHIQFIFDQTKNLK